MDWEERFLQFRTQAAMFSRDVLQDFRLTLDPAKSAKLNLAVTKMAFSKWSIEIFVTLYTLKSAAFQDLRRALKPISARVLSQKLKAMEDAGLVQRTVVDARPPRTAYALTEKGLTVSRLGEPVILYLRLSQGLL